MNRNLIFSIFTFFCVTIVSQLIAQQSLTFNPRTTDKGLIFGSITFPKEKAHFNEYFIQISYKAADAKTARKNFKEVHISPAQIFKMKHKGELDNGLTYVFAIERPEGENEITGIRLFSNSGFAILQKNSGLGGFSIPFKVNKGEILYIGNIVFNEYAEKDEVAVTYQNNFAKDLVGIKRVQKYVYWDAAKEDKSINISYKKEE